jgi:hypothetical protein
MIADFVGLLMASASVSAPAQPSAASLSIYSGSLVQVDWTNGDATKQTRVYRRIGAGAWSLRATIAAATVLYQTGDNQAGGYTYGVAHYDPTTGLESAILTATQLPPDDPTGVTTTLYSISKIQVEWDVNATYSTRVYRFESGVWALKTTAAPGDDSWPSGYTSGSFAVSHYNSSTGQESNLVEAEA